MTRHNLREWMNKKAKTKTQVQAFRADQIFYWLYQQRVESFAEMHNLGKGMRKLLEENFWISSLKKSEKLHSRDGSIKYRLLLADGELSLEARRASPLSREQWAWSVLGQVR